MNGLHATYALFSLPSKIASGDVSVAQQEMVPLNHQSPVDCCGFLIYFFF